MFARILAITAIFLLVMPARGRPEEGSSGLTRPIVLPPYDPNRPACSKPPGLDNILAFAQDNERKFMQGVSGGLEQAARDRGMQYLTMQAANDASRMMGQVRHAVEMKVGALIAAPVDPLSLAPALQRAIWSGAYVGTVVPPPATTILNAPQYETGKVLGDEAARYIVSRLGGKANVVILSHDSLQFLAPRFTAMRDALRKVPAATIVADISPLTVDEAGGAAMMRTILLTNTRIDVVLGADTVVLGALSALREAGKARNDQFIGGIDGEPAAVEEIRRGGPYKVSVSLASPIFGYALGQFAADWLEGKTVPQAMDILPRALSQENLSAYEADTADPGAVYRDSRRRDRYLRMYGNICFDTRDQYLNFPWSSERH